MTIAEMENDLSQITVRKCLVKIKKKHLHKIYLVQNQHEDDT